MQKLPRTKTSLVNNLDPYAPTKPKQTAAWSLWWVFVVITAVVVVAGASFGLQQNEGSASAARQRVEQPVQDEHGQSEAAEEPPVAPPPGDLTTASSVWAPGTTFLLTADYPQPGVPFDAGECTIAFSFSGADGRHYAVTASHCGSEGMLIWPRDASTVEDYAHEVGRVIYSHLDSYDGQNPVADVGIIEIYNPDRPMEVSGDPVGATILTYTGGEQGTPACKAGGTTATTCGHLGSAGDTYLLNDPETTEQVRSVGDTAYLCAERGDSGGPVYVPGENGNRIVGLVSGTKMGVDGLGPGCESEDAAIAFATTQQIVDVIYQVVPDAVLIGG